MTRRTDQKNHTLAQGEIEPQRKTGQSPKARRAARRIGATPPAALQTEESLTAAS
jgi:hypothetical protein